MTILFLVGFVFNEMIHVALAYYQAKGDFVTSSKQIILRTIVYGVGAWVLVLQGFTITSLIIFQVMTLVAFFVVAHLSVPKNDIELTSNTTVKNKLQESGKKMVLTTFSSALISELDIVLLGLIFDNFLLKSRDSFLLNSLQKKKGQQFIDDYDVPAMGNIIEVFNTQNCTFLGVDICEQTCEFDNLNVIEHDKTLSLYVDSPIELLNKRFTKEYIDGVIKSKGSNTVVDEFQSGSTIIVFRTDDKVKLSNILDEELKDGKNRKNST